MVNEDKTPYELTVILATAICSFKSHITGTDKYCMDCYRLGKRLAHQVPLESSNAPQSAVQPLVAAFTPREKREAMFIRTNDPEYSEPDRFKARDKARNTALSGNVLPLDFNQFVELISKNAEVAPIVASTAIYDLVLQDFLKIDYQHNVVEYPHMYDYD